MRDVALPYRAPAEGTKQNSDSFVLWLAMLAMTIVFVLISLMARTEINALEQRLAASEACLANLHITMTRLDNPGPERGATVATVSCKGE